MRSLFIGFLLGILVGGTTVYWYDHRTGKTETAAPEVRQKDNSLVLERKPGATIHKPNLMKGSKIDRQIEVNIQPSVQGCPICTVDLTVVETTDGTRRVVAASPNGTILGGLDVPFGTLPKQTKWSAGAVYSGKWGAILLRDVGPFQVGGMITDDSRLKPWAVLMVRW